MKILLIEDEARVASFLEKGLEAQGFVVEWVRTGGEALGWAEAAAEGGDVELVILDLGLPDVDGIEVLRALRSTGINIPVIVLTARSRLDDRVRGLDEGADDYLAKPFAFDELLARVRARLRVRDEGPATVLESPGLRLDLLTREVTVGERVVSLSPREFALLETFLRHPRQVLSRAQLLSRVWGLDFDPDSNVVDVSVGNLRRKIGPGWIETIRGAGYRLSDGATGRSRVS